MSKFDFKLEVAAKDHHKNYVMSVLKNGKAIIEEAAPIAYVHYMEDISVMGNNFIIVAKNIPIHLYPNVKKWIENIKRSLA